MQNFHKILFVSHGIGDEAEGLKQALAIARNNQAALDLLVTCPELPESLGDYRSVYRDALENKMREAVASARDSLKLDAEALPVTYEVDCGSTPAERCIRRVINDDFDLLIKNVEASSQRKGFKALDMELLRKCPCPVWLCRPILHSRGDIRVAVAVDPEFDEPGSYDLAIRMLRLSRNLADSCSGELHIISCWDYEIDTYLRENFPLNISDEDLDRAMEQAMAKHRGMLDALIHASGVGGKLEIHHVVARPDRFIPLLIEEKKIDILTMGTVARTGIPGFIMGNTAENILQKISCSLLALKPSGYISPVKI